MEGRYNVYEITPGGKYASCYRGSSLIAAENAEEANKIILKEMQEDEHNERDTWGYRTVQEYDIIENVYATVKGIVHYGIYYYG